ncbi:MAG: lipid-A-disaccharide synthase [Blastocatellia bacterium]|nr:lipid-A-disaccharide synthase [Blastocatellia bacterium]
MEKANSDQPESRITRKSYDCHASLSTHHPSRITLMMVAGEASGDKHGAALARALRRLYPETEFEIFGAGGDEMREAGVETLVDARDVAIIGFIEIARALGRLYRAFRSLIAEARERRPDAVVVIDWPDFNLRVARRMRLDGFKVVYYISPQVWAWKRHRIRRIRRDVDRMLVILPFEEEFYRKHSVEVEYVGHPLAQAVRATATRDQFARRHTLDPSRPMIALLPGSRKKEIHYHLPAMLDAARRLSSAQVEIRVGGSTPFHQLPGLEPEIPNRKSKISASQFLIPLASTIERSQVESEIGEAKSAGALDITIVERDLYDALCHAEFAVVASGTATVETALSGTPMVIIYRGSELNWRLIRPLIHLDTFGMVNLIAGRRVVPELIQHDVTGEKIAREVLAILSDPARLSRMREDLAYIHERLDAAGDGGPERAARAVMRLIGG